MLAQAVAPGWAVKVTPPAPKRIETVVEPLFAMAISCLPSPLKSPIATDDGFVPTLMSVVPLKPPLPSPKRIETEAAL